MARRAAREEPADRDLGPAADAESVARTILLAKLSTRARSRQELASALTAKGVPAEIAARVLDRFEQVGLVDDQAFAEAWVESRHRSRGLSRRALADELRRRGVDRAVAETATARIGHDAEREAASALVARKLRSLSGADEAAAFRRLTGLLARRGYPPSVAIPVVREALGRDEEFD
jgi:regulatory protein